MLIGFDTRNIGRGAGTGVTTYVSTLKAACEKTGHRPMLLQDEGNSPQSAHDLLPRLSRALRSTRACRHPEVRSTGYSCKDLYRTAEVRDRLWRRATSIKSPRSPAIMHWTYPLPLVWSGIPNVVTIHDLIPILHPELSGIPRDRIKRRIQSWCERASAIVTVSDAVKSDLMTTFDVPSDIIFMSSQPVCFSEPLLKAASQATSPCEPGGFLYFGTLERRKNIGRIIDAHSRSMTNRPLTLIGEKGFEWDLELQKLGSHRAPDRVKIVPWCQRSALIRAIREARAVVFPSLAEGFGLPIVEAMALGTPVITSFGHATEEVAGSAAWLVHAGDTEALAYAIDKVDRDDSLHAELSRAGLERASEFDFDTYSQRMSLFYQSLGAC
ncbi:glycosyltransferase family 4 protein [Asaia siamensis]